MQIMGMWMDMGVDHRHVGGCRSWTCRLVWVWILDMEVQSLGADYGCVLVLGQIISKRVVWV